MTLTTGRIHIRPDTAVPDSTGVHMGKAAQTCKRRVGLSEPAEHRRPQAACAQQESLESRSTLCVTIILSIDQVCQ